MHRAFARPFLLLGLFGLLGIAAALAALPLPHAPGEHICPLGPEGGHAPDLRLGDWGSPD